MPLSCQVSDASLLLPALEVELKQNRISEYEAGKGGPRLPVLSRYARLAGVCVDGLIDDEQDLHAKLPAKPKHS